MRKERVGFDKAERAVSMRSFFDLDAEDNSAQRSAMKQKALEAIRNELTEKQRNVFIRYYAQGETIPAIACELGLNKSTVARHLKVARERLRKIFSYNMIPLMLEDDLRAAH